MNLKCPRCTQIVIYGGSFDLSKIYECLGCGYTDIGTKFEVVTK